MAMLEVARSVEIGVDPAIVRRQFGDVAHHANTGVHRDVTFEVVAEDESRCRYRQISKVGPVRLRQEFDLERNEHGPLVNRIVAGPFTGGSITFEVEPVDDGTATVTARLVAPLSAPLRMLAPMMRAQVGRQLTAALEEDKQDLEGGHYPFAP